MLVLSFMRRLGKRMMIVCNVAAGMLFLGGAYVKLFNPAAYWFLSLLTLALPYLILILVLFFFFWLLIRPGWSLLSVIFIAIGWHAVQQIIPPRLHTDFTMEKQAHTIRIMSWNVEQFKIKEHKPESLNKILDLINLYNPDIACLQEVVAGEGTKGIIHYREIEQRLSFLDNFYAYRMADDYDRNHHFGTAIFSKYPIIRKQFMVNTPDNYNSAFQFVDLLIGGDTVRVFNVHLQSLRFSKEDREYLDSRQLSRATTEESKNIIYKIKQGVIRRAVQARFVRDAIANTAYPKVVCGDFNDVPASYAYEEIGQGMQNAFTKKGAGLSRTYTEISPTLRIDNIFVDKTFGVVQFKRIKKLLSDHYPIVTDVVLEPPAKK